MMDKELPHPKSAPVQAPLQQSTKNLRIPIASSSSGSEPSKNTSRLYHSAELKNLQKDHDNRINRASPSSSSTSKSIDDMISRTSSVSDDTKRLVDQFYSQESSPPSKTLFRQPHSRSSSSGQLLNNFDNNFELIQVKPEKKSFQQDINSSTFNYLKFIKRQELKEEEIKDRVSLDINNLTKEILDKVESQISQTNVSYSQDSQDFKEMLKELNSIETKISDYINLIQSNHELFESDYDKFQKELIKLYDYLNIIKTYEYNLKKSRDKLNFNKMKLFKLKQKVEITEDLKDKQLKLTKIRRKWSIIGFGIILMIYLIWRNL